MWAHHLSRSWTDGTRVVQLCDAAGFRCPLEPDRVHHHRSESDDCNHAIIEINATGAITNGPRVKVPHSGWLLGAFEDADDLDRWLGPFHG